MTSFWIDPHPREGWTAYCSVTMNQPIPMDLPDAGQRIWQRRADMLATAEALKQARQVGVIRRANVVSN